MSSLKQESYGMVLARSEDSATVIRYIENMDGSESPSWVWTSESYHRNRRSFEKRVVSKEEMEVQLDLLQRVYNYRVDRYTVFNVVDGGLLTMRLVGVAGIYPVYGYYRPMCDFFRDPLTMKLPNDKIYRITILGRGFMPDIQQVEKTEKYEYTPLSDMQRNDIYKELFKYDDPVKECADANGRPLQFSPLTKEIAKRIEDPEVIEFLDNLMICLVNKK